MLSPTHEEEITSLVASSVKSYKDLPLRLYQITRKFRDELRPRHGLLRTREFTMKDLYTFDVSHEAALETYSNVQTIYAALFDALKLPIMVAQASSGDMGDAVLDDRRVPFGWKMKDADLVGYPVVVVIGRAWKEAGRCELQCRRLGVKETVALADIRDRILELLRQL
ncbi:putative proline--tRNA ligase [Colletotrichum orbiculare MAFF 240422]|uniref:proline--tRNA ligase n=1 Tax=Colletotrichum orbiculare (strain 104-T / ATCC 96160 / CBS 514.97 / LARS 414 / MAFF 240422) TaxID=1213857 RepID=A0A484FYK9_COLOR|nr:putative proline--tRNA ligase [Colletotrichum orbiculare MAFF 240422]